VQLWGLPSRIAAKRDLAAGAPAAGGGAVAGTP
jgi:hypothetical protein